jgi:hypothetical protein
MTIFDGLSDDDKAVLVAALLEHRVIVRQKALTFLWRQPDGFVSYTSDVVAEIVAMARDADLLGWKAWCEKY